MSSESCEQVKDRGAVRAQIKCPICSLPSESPEDKYDTGLLVRMIEKQMDWK